MNLTMLGGVALALFSSTSDSDRARVEAACVDQIEALLVAQDYEKVQRLTRNTTVHFTDAGLRRRYFVAVAIADLERAGFGPEPMNPFDLARWSPVLANQLSSRQVHADEASIEADQLLVALAKHPLDSDAEGYRTLARIRHLISDGPGSEIAVQQCQRTAKSNSQCRLGARPYRWHTAES